MHYVGHLHPASAASQALRLDSFLESGAPCLALVRHSRITLLSLDGQWREAHDIALNARILRIAQAGSSLLVLTDHHAPRLIALQEKDGKIVSTASAPLDEPARQVAELGMGLEVEPGPARVAAAHAHAGIIKAVALGSDGELDPTKVFLARLPHPHLINMAMLHPAARDSPPSLALLSISSTPTSIPGLGQQCLPVLSFHTLDATKQELAPQPWGPPPRSASISSSSRTDAPRRASSSRSMPGAFEEEEQGKQGGTAAASSSRNGPAAFGFQRTAEQQEKHEAELARTALTRAHVPLPPADALGAHFLFAVDTAAGGGVIVFCESSILYVPSPSSRANASSSSLLETPGKRRKASTSSMASPRQEGSAPAPLSTSPSKRSNEHGKRRRSSVASSSALATSPTTTTTGPPSPTATRKKSSASRLVRLDLATPTVVVAATPLIEPGEAAPSGRSTFDILYATHAGALNVLTLHLPGGDGPQIPTSLSTSKLGDTSVPGGSAGLSYLGEGFVQVASASGDTQLLHISSARTGEAAESGTGDVVMQDADAAADPTLTLVKSWPNLGPTLDFIVDDGAGGDPSVGTSAQARVITASGSGPTGSLRIVRNGVVMQELGELEEADVKHVWTASDSGTPGAPTQLVCLGYSHAARFLATDKAGGMREVSNELRAAGADLGSPPLEFASIGGGVSLYATSKRISLVAPQSLNVVADAWTAPSGSEIAAISSNAQGQALVGLSGGKLLLLKLEGQTLRQVSETTLSSEVSALDISPLGEGEAGFAAIAQWGSRSVRLLKLPELEDRTPSALGESLSALPRSVKLHAFTKHAKAVSPPHLLVGLGDGSLASYALDFPPPGSWSSAIGVLERRTATIGTQPPRLSSFETDEGLNAILAASDRSTIIFSEGTRMTYSAMRQRDVSDGAQLWLAGEGGESSGLLMLARPTSIVLASIGAVQNLEVRTVELGRDNPLALTQSSAENAVGVVTWRFKPEGSATKLIEPEGQVKVFDSASFQELSSIELDAHERPNCIEAVTLPDGSHCFVVGTGKVPTNPERSETISGRILGYRLAGPSRQLERIFEHDVAGNVFAIAQVQGDGHYLAAAVNSQVLTFVVEEEEESIITTARGAVGMQLRRVGQWGCAFTACTLSSPEPGRLLVGDALRSLAVLRVSDVPTERGRIVELARDCDPYWTTAAEQLDASQQLFIGSDIAFNLFSTQRLPLTSEAKRRTKEAIARDIEMGRRPEEAEESSSNALASNGDETWSHVMERRGAWHYGDMINRFRRGALVSKPKAVLGKHDVEPVALFCTAGGAIGLLAALDDEAGAIVSAVERNVNQLEAPLGNLEAEAWRTLRTDHRVAPPAGFVDGDVLARFAALDAGAKTRVLEGPQSEHAKVHADPQQVNALVEALGRLA